MSTRSRLAGAAAALALAACGGARPGLSADTTAPEITSPIPLPANSATSPLTISVSATDAQSGVAAVRARVTATTNPIASTVEGVYDETRKVWTLALPLENGNNAVVIWSVDRVGNSGEKLEPPHSLSVTVAAALTPTVSAPVPVPQQTSVSPYPLAVVVQGGVGGIKGVHANVKPANDPVSSTVEGVYDETRKVWTLALPLENGDNAVVIWAVDAAGHSGETLAAPYSLSFTATATLTPTVSAPVPLPPKTDQTPFPFVVVAQGGEGGVTAVHARVKPAATPFATTVDGTYDAARGIWHLALPLENGENSVLVWAVDGAGHSGEHLDAPYSLAATITAALTPTVSLPVPVPLKTGQSPFPLAVVAEGGQSAGIKGVHARVKPAATPVATTVAGTYDAARGIWDLALPLANGVNSVLVWAVDGAGNSGEHLGPPFSLNFDIEAAITPPTLSASAAPPAWTNGHAVTLYLAAGDTGNGIARVLCSVGASIPVAAEQISGGWLCTLSLAPGANAISAWATDPQGRSGRGRGAPYEVTATVNQTTTAPVVSVGYYESYRPEAGASLRSTKVPPDVDYHGLAKVTIGNGSIVSKLMPTLTWGPSAPTIDELEGANAHNVPFVAFEVLSAAPITSATCAVSFPGYRDGGPPIPPAVTMMRSARVVGGRTVFLVPLARETIFPSFTSSARFAQYGAIRALTVGLAPTVVDAAGNSGTLTISVDLQMVGSPLHVVEDTEYPAKSVEDKLSVYRYRLANGRYVELAADSLKNASEMPNELRTAGALRLIRYVVTNPWPEPLSLEAAIGATTACGDQNYSTWDLWEASTYVAVPWAKSYAGLNPTETWRYLYQNNCGIDPTRTCPPAAPGPCMEADPDRGSNDNRLYPVRELDGRWTCISTPDANAAIHAVPARPIASANGIATTAVTMSDAPAPLGSGGEVVIPAASGSTPGQLAVYITRRVDDWAMRGVAARFSPTTFTPYWPLSPSAPDDPITSTFAAPAYDYWRIDSWESCHYGTLGFYQATHCIGHYQAYRLIRQLTAASEHVCATLTIGSRAYDAKAGAVGQRWTHPDYSTTLLQRVIAH
jgi:hypothetical protein